MPDSWIDKKELEELVGSFASPRKSRRKPLAPRSRGDDNAKENVPPTTETEPVEAEPVEAEPVETLVDPPFLDQEPPPAIEQAEIRVMEPEESEELDPESDSIFVFEEDPGTEDTVSSSGVVADGFEDAGEAAASDPPPEAIELLIETNDDAPLVEEVFAPGEEETVEESLPTEAILPPWWIGEDSALEPLESFESLETLEWIREEPAPCATVPVEKTPLPSLPEELPEIRIESAEESYRDLPPFLDEPEEIPSPRPVSLSERDADRALIALAEARARVERSQLLRVRPIPDEPPPILPEPKIESDLHPVATTPLTEPGKREEAESGSVGAVGLETPAAEFESGEAAEPPSETPQSNAKEADDAVVSPESVPPVASIAEAETEPDAPGLFDGERFLRRVGRFGEEARRRLGAREVIVCDRDGLILYSDVEERAGGVLETALLLEVSARANRLLGLASSRATQVSVGGGLWRCLLKESGIGGDLYAGLLLPEPLEEDQIALWIRILSEVSGTPAPNFT